MRDRLLTIINTVLTNRSNDPVSELNPEMNLRNDIGFDSMDLADLTVRIEAEFDVDIFEDGIVETVGEILEKLEAEA
ncbi:MAG: acyl carrier protein [Oceanospirillaceae bacterium]|nr:acyl carrier protein [Oceanospirillaceae bacterium]